MKRSRWTAALAAAIAITISNPAAAQTFMEGIDADGSGNLDVEEFVFAMAERELRMYDSDGDEVLTRDEWLGGGDEWRVLSLERYNTDDNPEVMSAQEMVELYLWIFGNRETDKDGLLSSSEAPPFFISNQ